MFTPFTEVPNAAEMMDKLVERRELDDVTDTQWSDEPFEKCRATFSTETVGVGYRMTCLKTEER
jgi:hypothetical protein